MKERVQALGGQFEIRSVVDGDAAQRGTEIDARLPLV